MTRKRPAQVDPIEHQIELALNPGAFIPDGACFSFVGELDEVAARIAKLKRWAGSSEASTSTSRRRIRPRLVTTSPGLSVDSCSSWVVAMKRSRPPGPTTANTRAGTPTMI